MKKESGTLEGVMKNLQLRRVSPGIEKEKLTLRYNGPELRYNGPELYYDKYA